MYSWSARHTLSLSLVFTALASWIHGGWLEHGGVVYGVCDLLAGEKKEGRKDTQVCYSIHFSLCTTVVCSSSLIIVVVIVSL